MLSCFPVKFPKITLITSFLEHITIQLTFLSRILTDIKNYLEFFFSQSETTKRDFNGHYCYLDNKGYIFSYFNSYEKTPDAVLLPILTRHNPIVSLHIFPPIFLLSKLCNFFAFVYFTLEMEHIEMSMKKVSASVLGCFL